jgi:hypothetical protein
VDRQAVTPLPQHSAKRQVRTTFEKYEYQYHWALCRILGAHENSDDYVVFIELHEDVVFATSTDQSVARFRIQSGQKCQHGAPWNQRKLTAGPKGHHLKESYKLNSRENAPRSA